MIGGSIEMYIKPAANGYVVFKWIFHESAGEIYSPYHSTLLDSYLKTT
jgi:hypothetical protein